METALEFPFRHLKRDGRVVVDFDRKWWANESFLLLCGSNTVGWSHCYLISVASKITTFTFLPEQRDLGLPECEAVVLRQHAEVGAFHVRIGGLEGRRAQETVTAASSSLTSPLR